MADLTEGQRETLGQAAQHAAQIRELLKHPGMAIMRAEIDKRILRNRSKWYEADNAQEAEQIRLDTKGYEAFFALTKELMLRGDNAQRLLNTPTE